MNPIFIILGIIFLAGCSVPTESDGSQLGGTLLTRTQSNENSSIVRNSANEFLGSVIGANIIGSQNPGNAAYAKYALNEAMEYNSRGVTSEWYNNFNNSMGSITPTKTFLVDGVYCRHFIETQRVNGRLISADGTACRVGAKQWVVQR